MLSFAPFPLFEVLLHHHEAVSLAWLVCAVWTQQWLHHQGFKRNSLELTGHVDAVGFREDQVPWALELTGKTEKGVALLVLAYCWHSSVFSHPYFKLSSHELTRPNKAILRLLSALREKSQGCCKAFNIDLWQCCTTLQIKHIKQANFMAYKLYLGDTVAKKKGNSKVGF